MGSSHIVVDGSNIATEGRSLPSLQQLLDAVDAVAKDQNPETVTVIVDATFGHRIEQDERDAYEDKISNGEIITPPAGVIGRGDAFILEVADRADAIVLSNDSFQEFHGTYRWLFDEGRLLGGKHVPGVGWIFLDRSPVRGPASRKAVSEAKRKRGGKKATKKSKKASKKSSTKAKSSKKRSGSKKKAQPAEASGGQGSGKGKEPEPYNEPLPFIEFVGANEVGSVVEGEVEQFSSHGAYVLVGDTRCYIALKAMGDPPPRSAREVLTQGETRSFQVEAIDTPRRGIDLSLADGPVTPPAEDAPSDDTPDEPQEPVEPEAPRIAEADLDDPDLSVSQRRKLRARFAAQQAADAADAAAPKKKAATKKRAGKKKAAAKNVSTKKSPSKKRAAKTSGPKKATPARRVKKAATKKKAASKKSAKKSAKKATKRKSSTKKAAKRKSASKKTTARTKSPTKKKSATKKSAAKRSAAKKSAAKKSQS